MAFHTSKSALGGKGTHTNYPPKDVKDMEAREARYNIADTETPTEDATENPKRRKQGGKGKPSLTALHAMVKA